MPNALAIFAKAPVAGQVKTRLCPPLTPEQAADLSRCFLLDTAERMCRLDAVQVFLAITPADSQPLFRSLLPFPVRYQPQRGASLGERQMNTLHDLIGSDIPSLPAAHVQAAFRRLEDPGCDAVFDPSRDGGYYLVGVREVHRPLFENIAWSTPQVLQQTLEQARRHGYAVALVPSWYDVDTPQDLLRLASETRGREGEQDDAPRTRQALARLGFDGGQ